MVTWGMGNTNPVIMTVNSFVLLSPEILARATVHVTVGTAGQNRGTRPRPWDWRFLSGFRHIPGVLEAHKEEGLVWTSRRKSGDSQQDPSPPANLAGWRESDGGRGGARTPLVPGAHPSPGIPSKPLEQQHLVLQTAVAGWTRPRQSTERRQ